MTPERPPTKEVVIKVCICAVPLEITASQVGLEVYRAVVEALREKYAIMGYSWDNE